MNKTWVSFLIFFIFLLIQEPHIPFHRVAMTLNKNVRLFVPVNYTIDQRIQPPRKFVRVMSPAPNPASLPFLVQEIHSDGTITLKSPVPPAVAMVFGRKMDWEKVTVEDLRRIPGISTLMAQRLIRLRDTTEISSFRDLLSYPHVGRKTVKRLEDTCVIPHES